MARLAVVSAALLIGATGTFASLAEAAPESDNRLEHAQTLATQPRNVLCGAVPTEKLVTARVGDMDLSVDITEDSSLFSVTLDNAPSGPRKVRPYALYSLKFVPLPADAGEIDALSALVPAQVWTEKAYGSLPYDNTEGSVLFRHIPIEPGIWWMTDGESPIGGAILAKFRAVAKVESNSGVVAQTPRESESCESIEGRIEETQQLGPSLPPVFIASETRYPDPYNHYCGGGRAPGSFASTVSGRVGEWHSERIPGRLHERYFFALHLDASVWRYDSRCLASLHEQYDTVGKIHFSVYGPSEAPAQAGVAQWSGYGLGIETWRGDDNSPRGWHRGTALKGPFIHVQDGGSFRIGDVRHIAYTGQQGDSKASRFDLVILALNALRLSNAALVAEFAKYLDEDNGPTRETSKPGCVHACLDWRTSSALTSGSYFGFEASVERVAPGYSAYPVDFGVSDFEFHRTYDRRDLGSVRASMPTFSTFIPMWST